MYKKLSQTCCLRTYRINQYILDKKIFVDISVGRRSRLCLGTARERKLMKNQRNPDSPLGPSHLKLTLSMALVVAQVVERSLPTPEIRYSNPIFGQILSTNCTITNRKDENNRPGMAHLKKNFIQKQLTHLFNWLVIDAALLILLLLSDEIGVVEVEVGRGRDLLDVAEQEVENSSGIFGLFFDWNGINCFKRSKKLGAVWHRGSVCASHPAAPGLILGIHKNYPRCCCDSSKVLNNVERTNLVQQKLQIVTLSVVGTFCLIVFLFSLEDLRQGPIYELVTLISYCVCFANAFSLN